MKIGICLKKALIFDKKFTREELILQTIYNNKCASLSSIWERFELNKEITSIYKTKSILKRDLFDKWEEKNWLIRGRAFDIPKYKNSGYSVNVEEAYKDKLPYTLTFLNPLPVVHRQDYIYHLLIIDRALPYKIFPQNYHQEIDELNVRITDLLNRKSISVIEAHKELVKELNKDENLNKIIEEGESLTFRKPLSSHFNLTAKINDFLTDKSRLNKKAQTYENLQQLSKQINELNYKDIPLN